MPERIIDVDGPLDLARTLRALHVRAGSAAVIEGSTAWRAGHTPDGPASVRLEQRNDQIRAKAYGPGAHWQLERVPGLLGLHDDPFRFEPPLGLVRDLHRRAAGLRIGRTERVFEALLPTILGQKVTGLEAGAGYRGLVRRYGQPAPGPVEIRLPPPPERIATLTYADLHPFGIERKRAATLIEAARRASRLEEAVGMSPEDADRRFRAVRGIGEWSSAFALGMALGDADAIPVGDYHLPHTVAWALAGEDRGTDERMLELLEPYRGHRRRVMLLLKGAGIHAPRYGPRMTVRGIERI